MPRKTSPSRPPNEPIMMKRPRTEVDQKLAEQIEQGRALLARTISSEGDLKQADEAYDAWNSYNTALLRQLFTTDEFQRDYTFWGVAFVGGKSPMLPEKINDFREEVEGKVKRLSRVKAKLPAIDEVELPQPGTVSAPGSAPRSIGRKVFIVHGRDEGAKESVARFISNIGLDPVILAEQPNQGMTLIEKLERYGKPDFAVVLFTPDDVGALQAEQDRLQPRARQNVVLEYGYFAAALGRDKVCALYKKGVELPSDIGGLGLLELDPAGGWRLPLFQEIEAAKLPAQREGLFKS